MPIYQDHWKTNQGRWQQTALGIRSFSNEIVYKKLTSCESVDEAVNRFNRMILEYLEAKVGDNELDEKSTLFYPLKEFKDYFMRTDNSMPNLLRQENQDIIKTSPFADVLFHNTAGKYWYNPDAEESFVIDVFSYGSYTIVIDAENQTLEVKAGGWKTKSDKKSVTATWKECGLNGTQQGGMNRHLQLLMRYAFYQALCKQPNVNEKFQFEYFKNIIGVYYEWKTLQSYHSHLKKILKDLLHLHNIPPSHIYENQQLIETRKHFIAHHNPSKSKYAYFYELRVNVVYKKLKASNKQDTLGKKAVEDLDIWSSSKDVYSMNDVRRMEDENYPYDEIGQIKDSRNDTSLDENYYEDSDNVID